MENPVVEYSTSDLSDKAVTSRLELDKVVLERWDMLMQKGYFR